MDASGGGPPHRGPSRDGAGAPADPGDPHLLQRSPEVKAAYDAAMEAWVDAQFGEGPPSRGRPFGSFRKIKLRLARRGFVSDHPVMSSRPLESQQDGES